MTVESYTLKELDNLLQNGGTYRLFKPFFYQGQMLLNIEKILTSKDLYKLEGKVFGPIQVVSSVEHNTDEKLRNAVVANVLSILKTSSLFKIDDVHHLDYAKRKECEKLLAGIINGTPHLAQQLLKIYKFSKKLFVHSVNVGIIATIIDLGIQEKKKSNDALRSEELLTAALLHDIGFFNLPKLMLEKKRYEYNEKEKNLYKTYVLESKTIAESLGDNLRKRTIEIIYQHQERLPGNGFPEGLKGNKINEMSLIVGLADEFDLLLANELSSSKRTPTEVMSRISTMGNIFSTQVVDSFYTWFRYLK